VHYVIRWRESIYPVTHIITDCTQLPQQTKKTVQQNPFTHHQRSVKVSDDVRWQDKIGLRQFDNYLSQVKINVTTVNNKLFLAILKISGEFFIFQQDSAKTDLAHEPISFFACNLGKCWLNLFHDLLLRSYLYHCVWSVITAHNLTPEKRDTNYSPHPLIPTSCLRNNIQLITGVSPCCGCL